MPYKPPNSLALGRLTRWSFIAQSKPRPLGSSTTSSTTTKQTNKETGNNHKLLVLYSRHSPASAGQRGTVERVLEEYSQIPLSSATLSLSGV